MPFARMSVYGRARRLSVALSVVAILVAAAPAAAGPDGAASAGRSTHSSRAVRHDTSAPLRDMDPAPLIDLSADPNWRKYRYRVYQTVIPLRNVIWAGV